MTGTNADNVPVYGRNTTTSCAGCFYFQITVTFPEMSASVHGLLAGVLSFNKQEGFVVFNYASKGAL